ncbi:hypothetical protein V5O48_002945 [Marasmius crinis-equi]|uniref:Uncharacterized protein n=1 Tax=Marasmius crinis-equi TaxID=585013 RepID=A0ABR3FUQ7_9AGAR
MAYVLQLPARIYPERCFRCGDYSGLKSHETRKLRSFLSVRVRAFERPVVQQSLKKFGILHNGHLKQLCSLSPGELQWVLVDCEGLSPEDVIEFAKEIGHKDTDAVAASIDSMWCESHRGPIGTSCKPASRKLQSLLVKKGLEVLTPVAEMYGFHDDRELDKNLRYARDPSIKYLLPLYGYVTPYYRRLMELVLRELACGRPCEIKQESRDD